MLIVLEVNYSSCSEKCTLCRNRMVSCRLLAALSCECKLLVGLGRIGFLRRRDEKGTEICENISEN